MTEKINHIDLLLGPFQTEPLHFILLYFILINNSFKNEKNDALFKRALDAVLRSIFKKMNTNENMPSCFRGDIAVEYRPLMSDSTHREMYYESAIHHVNTPKRTGAYCCLPQVGGAAACCCCQV